MAWTASDLAAIDAAIASGVQKVRFADGKEVTYASVDALLRARALIGAEVNGAAAIPVNRSSFAEFRRD
jgi:hypothetical protein